MFVGIHHNYQEYAFIYLQELLPFLQAFLLNPVTRFIKNKNYRHNKTNTWSKFDNVNLCEFAIKYKRKINEYLM